MSSHAMGLSVYMESSFSSPLTFLRQKFSSHVKTRYNYYGRRKTAVWNNARHNRPETEKSQQQRRRCKMREKVLTEIIGIGRRLACVSQLPIIAKRSFCSAHNTRRPIARGSARTRLLHDLWLHRIRHVSKFMTKKIILTISSEPGLIKRSVLVMFENNATERRLFS